MICNSDQPVGQWIYSEGGLDFVITQNPSSAPAGVGLAPISGESLTHFAQIVESYGGSVTLDSSYNVTAQTPGADSDGIISPES